MNLEWALSPTFRTKASPEDRTPGRWGQSESLDNVSSDWPVLLGCGPDAGGPEVRRLHLGRAESVWWREIPKYKIEKHCSGGETAHDTGNVDI